MKAMHLMGQAPYYTNSYLICSEAGNAIVFDPAASLDHYQQALEKLGAKLQYIVLTHGHFDHTYTLDALKEATGAKVLAGKEDLRGGGIFPVSEADGCLEDGGVIQLDELEIHCWHTPGHSPGSFCFLVESLFITGDTLFAGSIGRTDLEAGSWPVLEESLKKLLTLPVPDTAQVLPGHNDFSTFGREKVMNGFLQF